MVPVSKELKARISRAYGLTVRKIENLESATEAVGKTIEGLSKDADLQYVLAKNDHPDVKVISLVLDNNSDKIEIYLGTASVFAKYEGVESRLSVADLSKRLENRHITYASYEKRKDPSTQGPIYNWGQDPKDLDEFVNTAFDVALTNTFPELFAQDNKKSPKVKK